MQKRQISSALPAARAQLLTVHKRLSFHLSDGGLPALLRAGVRWWRRRKAKPPAPPDPNTFRIDPVGRAALLIVADRPLDFCVGVHPAAMLFAAADQSGRSVRYVDVSQPSGIGELRTAAISLKGKGEVFVFASGALAAKAGAALRASRLCPNFEGDGPSGFDRPAVYATTAVADAYAAPKRPRRETDRPVVLVPVLEPLDPQREAALAALKAQGAAAIVRAAAPFDIERLPQGTECLRIGSRDDLIEAIRHADIVVPNLAAGDVRVAQTLVGVATMLQRHTLMTTEAGWNDSPLALESASGQPADTMRDGKAETSVDLYIAAHDALATLPVYPGTFAKSVSVIVLTHNNRSIIGRFLGTLKLHCSDFLAEVIVVDNASVDGSADYVAAEFPWVRLLRNHRNGCSSGRNLGAAAASGRYLAFFDSDQWFVSGAGFLEALILLDNNRELGAIGWNAGWFDKTRTDLGGMISDYAPRRGMNAAALARGYRTDIGFLGTSGMFMARERWHAIEGFDEYYDPTCFEDTDLSFQLKHAGLEVAFRDLTGIRHQPHQTTQADAPSEHYLGLFRRNGDYFRRKWDSRVPYVDYDWSAE